MAHPQTWLEATNKAKEAQCIVFSQNKKPSFIPFHKTTNHNPPTTSLNIHKLTHDKMVKRQLNGLCYNCDDKYFPGKKCKEQKIFMAMS
jgi:hypothetical protein